MFLNLEPWEEQLFISVQDKCDILIPVSDEVAYAHYPQYNWVYNKIEICKTQDIAAYPHGVIPTRYPVFSKPITNLYGMSQEARVLYQYDDTKYRPGHFWMPILMGTQLSTDFVVSEGVVVWHYTMEATVGGNDSFESWDAVEMPEELFDHLVQWIYKYLPSYTGIINLETIGDKIIECHLRMSAQWVDLYGEGWLESVVNLYKTGKWNFTGVPRFGTSKPLWVSYDCYPDVWDWNKLRGLEDRVSCIQLTWCEGHPLSHESHDVNGYRVAVVNGFDATKVVEVLEELKKIIGMKDGRTRRYLLERY